MRKLTLFLLASFIALALHANTQKLPEFGQEAAWQAGANSSARGEISQWPDRIAVAFNGTQGETFRVLLNNPLELPNWATDWTFIMGNEGGIGRINVWALITDAKGRHFRYRLIDPIPEFRTGYPVFKSGYRKAPIRLHAFGLKRPKLGANESSTIIAESGRELPVAPLILKGLELEAGSKESSGIISFGDFMLTGVTAAESELYYALEGTEHFGEVDPVPYITLADFGHFYGEVYDVEWELRDRYDGQPIYSGHKTFHLTEDDPTTPYSVQLAQRIEFPVQKKGTYWIQAKLRWAKSERHFPESIIEKDFRLDVIHSKFESNPEFTIAPDRPIEFAPERTSFIFEPDEALQLPVILTPAADAISEADSYRVTLQAFAGVGPIAEFTGPLNPDGKTTVLVDLAEKNEGAWTIHAELLQNGQVMDAKTQRIGHRAGSEHIVKASRKEPVTRSTDPTQGESLIMLYATS